ncbi:tyrosine-type recombinase/integrase [Spirosoma sp. HMF4905]|uniref:Tyrosine-type recombinase/integrase n=1 Tax=Spirosoma arboris TaxID=2682092 RepID=A0A7K1SNV8_9BACT|nr:site-specific integrase [Spirosoma arboris]MVM35479.1 tyrosine-type recombinase/integrase [Spirosoma arboris]
MAKTTDHKEGKATVKVVYYTHKTLKDGSHPFVVRITKNRKNRWISTGRSLPAKYWNDNYTDYRQAIRKSYPEPYRNELIVELERWEKKYEGAAESLASADEVHDVKDVASKAIEGRKQLRRSTLIAYTDELIVNMKRAGQLGNTVVYQILRNQLTDFLKSEFNKTDVRFVDVTVKFCNDFEIYMREKGNADTTLSNRFRTLRAILNKAISEGVASLENYPFSRSVSDRHKFSVSKFITSTQKRAITRDDIRKVDAFQPVATHVGAYAEVKNAAEVERLQRAKNIFMFSFYVGGINFVDLVQIRWRNLSQDAEGHTRLTYVRQKTGGKFSIRLLAPAMAIIEQYRPFTHNKPDSYIFDVLNTTVHNNPKSITNRLKKIMGQVNTDLKLIGERAGIDTPLTTYVARHSFATSLKRAGVATSVISATMGHKTEAITNVYLDSFASETIDSAFDALL